MYEKSILYVWEVIYVVRVYLENSTLLLILYILENNNHFDPDYLHIKLYLSK